MEIVNSLEELKGVKGIGKAIRIHYKANEGEVGVFSNLGGEGVLLPSKPIKNPDGFFNLIKVDIGLLIADRNIQNFIDWQKLNLAGFIDGMVLKLDEIDFKIRSLSGGIIHRNEYNGWSQESNGLGAYPNVNEWDKYINKESDYMWNSNANICYTMCQETPHTKMKNLDDSLPNPVGEKRIIRSKNIIQWTAITEDEILGFRPVFEFLDSNTNATNLFK